MKTLVVVVAGAADRPLEDLGGRTPLEAAATPALDRLAAEGRLGRVQPAPEGLRAEEGAFALSLFGIDPREHPDVGGLLDAAAFDVPVASLDQVFRLALVTADEQTIFDPTAGCVTRDEATLLLRALDDEVADPDLSFLPGDGWRNVLLWKGARDVRVSTFPPFEVVGKSLQAALPKGTGTGRLVAAIERSLGILGGHEVNELRRDLGENPATMAWPWAPGVAATFPSFEERVGARGGFVGVNPSFLGAARLQGIEVRAVEGATGRTDSNVRGKAEAAIRLLEEEADVAWLHVDSVASASHARDFVGKVEALERLDGWVIAPLAKAAEENGWRLAVVAGEAIGAESGRYLTDPVPFVLSGPGLRGHRRGTFTEVSARDAAFEVERAHELLDFLLNLPA